MDHGVQFGSAPIRHLRTAVDGIDTFYREAGPADAPVVLLPHGYPASSFVYRNLMAALGHRYRLIAPDLPGFGYSATPSPDEFGYTFDAYATFLQAFVDALNLNRYVIWLHDYGSQFGFRLALAAPHRVAGLIVQNGDIYEDGFGPKYDFLKESWENPGPAARRNNLIRLLEDQPSTLDWFATEQAFLRDHQPPTLIVWGPHDGYMPEKSARAYLRDLPNAPIHLLGGGHWLLETHLDEVVPLVDEFLAGVNSPNGT
jgi:pimeloyl-ACP methyl ester carboxylesterase